MPMSWAPLGLTFYLIGWPRAKPAARLEDQNAAQA
jgi:hypothetical protein